MVAKVAQGGENWEKLVKIGKRWEKLEKGGEKIGKDGKSWEKERKGQIVTDFQSGWIQIIKTMFLVLL